MLKTTRAVLDAVGSPALKIHLDPVNWMTFDTVYANGPAIAAMFAVLGPERDLRRPQQGRSSSRSR